MPGKLRVCLFDFSPCVDLTGHEAHSVAVIFHKIFQSFSIIPHQIINGTYPRRFGYQLKQQTTRIKNTRANYEIPRTMCTIHVTVKRVYDFVLLSSYDIIAKRIYDKMIESSFKVPMDFINTRVMCYVIRGI